MHGLQNQRNRSIKIIQLPFTKHFTHRAENLQITKWQSGSGSGGNPTWVAGELTACSIVKQPLIDSYSSQNKSLFQFDL